MKKIFSLLLVSIIFLACLPDLAEDFGLDPTVTTDNAMLRSNGGVTFIGSYEDNDREVVEKGFDYARDTTILNSSRSNRVVSNTETEGEIQAEVTTGLVNGLTYYYKAYVKVRERETTSIIHFGKIKNFTSNGSIIPEINSLSNSIGHLSDTLEIRGKYLIDEFINTEIDFSGVEANIISLTDSLIKCIVPDEALVENNVVRVKIGDREDIISPFDLYTPVINSVSPLNATFDEEITINGDHFDPREGESLTELRRRNKVFFGDVLADLTFVDRNTIKAKIPIYLDKSSLSLRIESQRQEVIFSQEVELHPIQITSIPSGVNTGEEITIIGENFNPILENNIITVEGIEVELIEGDTSNLKFKIPEGPFPRRKADIKIKVTDMELVKEVDILDDWVQVSNNLPFRFDRNVYNGMNVNNEAYIIAPERNDFSDKVYLWKMDDNDFSWEKNEIPFSINFGGVSVSNGNKIYVYTAKTDNSFWEYDPITKQWKELSSFIGVRRGEPAYFSINGDIYLGAGRDFNSNGFGDFYKYSVSQNSWIKISSLSNQSFFRRRSMATFVINGIAYVGNGALDTGAVQFWAYNPSSDSWTTVADFPDARSGTAGFSLNELGYITGGSRYPHNAVWQYNPSNNSWIRVENFSNDFFGSRRDHFSFTLNGKAYIGGGGIGNSGSSTGFDMYEFIPK